LPSVMMGPAIPVVRRAAAALFAVACGVAWARPVEARSVALLSPAGEAPPEVLSRVNGYVADLLVERGDTVAQREDVAGIVRRLAPPRVETDDQTRARAGPRRAH